MPEIKMANSMVNNRIEMDNGVTILTLAAEEFGGEHERRSLFYIGVLWLVSIWAMITNSFQAFFLKLFRKRSGSLGKILWEMGRDATHISSSFVDRFSQYNHLAKVGAASWQALHLFYNYHEEIAPQLSSNLEGWLTRYWIEKMENRQAVTNRKKVLVRVLTEALKRFNNESEVRVISIASGSAQAVVEAIQECPQLNVKVLLIDAGPSAIKEANKIIGLAGCNEKFSLICNGTRVLERVCTGFQPHIVEMVGFLDYRPGRKAIQLIRRIKDCLPEDGIFLTCNIRKNREKMFLDWLLLWPLIYRSEVEFSELLKESGFPPEKIQLIYEPFRIHGLAVCKK